MPYSNTRKQAAATSASQSKRQAVLLDKAQRKGWRSLWTCLTAVVRGVVELPAKPDGYDDGPRQP